MGGDWDKEINLVQSTIKRLLLIDKKKCPYPILSVSPLISRKPAINKLCERSSLFEISQYYKKRFYNMQKLECVRMYPKEKMITNQSHSCHQNSYSAVIIVLIKGSHQHNCCHLFYHWAFHQHFPMNLSIVCLDLCSNGLSETLQTIFVVHCCKRIYWFISHQIFSLARD